jgi:2-aminoadipate transaminase
LKKAIDSGVAFVPSGSFFVDGSNRNSMRLTFAREPEERLREGIRRLAAVVLA